jgi:hypothetical protein
MIECHEMTNGEYYLMPTGGIPVATGELPDLTLGALHDQAIDPRTCEGLVELPRRFTVVNVWSNRAFVERRITVARRLDERTFVAGRQDEARPG